MLSSLLASLIQWACGSQAESHLEQVFGNSLHWPTAYKHLSAFRSGNFSNLPPISILPPDQMPGLWGGYSRDLRQIFLSADCPADQLSAVLIEEIGHFLDQELCIEETPGEEGARFAAAVLGLSEENLAASDFLFPIHINGVSTLVEAAVKVVTIGTPKTSPNTPITPPTPTPDTITSPDGNTITANKTSVRLIQTKAIQTLVGSSGNDTFQVTSQNVSLRGNGGTDVVQSSVNFSLASFSDIQNLTLTGTALNATGNAQNNVITGNDANNSLDGASGNDTLDGGAGNDTLIGGTGNDSMIGGTGNDYYFVDSFADTIVESSLNGGIDSVSASINNYTLAANTEVLILAGTIASGRGNSLSNSLIGNASANSLNGGGGNDYFDGGSANDTLVGEDGNDTLEGGVGNDSLVGGAGKDYYFVDSLGDVVVESSGSDIDSVSASISGYTLANNAEVLVLAGTTASGTGNSLANTIFGNSAANTLNGGSGTATTDSLVGGAGDDFYFLNSSNDKIYELPSEGTDSVSVKFSGYTLATNTDVLILESAAGASNGTGNSLANTLKGNLSANTLDGGSGNDNLFGDFGSDSLVGGEGDDFLDGGSSNDTLLGGNDNDTLDGGIGNDSMVGGLGNDYYYVDSSSDIVNETLGGGGIDTVSANIDYTLTGGSEALILTGITKKGTGNTSANTIIGNTASNTLSGEDGNDYLDGGIGNDSLIGGDGADTLLGGAGNDTMVGGAGNDYYFVDSIADIISDSSGTDSVSASTSYQLSSDSGIEFLILTGNAVYGYGNTSANTLIGNSFANTLIGGAGNDYLDGGSGNDTLIGDSGTDMLDGGSGNDSLSGGAESDTLLGALGNDTLDGEVGDDSMSGGEGNDSLFGGGGNDTFDGGLGNDSMTGGSGNDYYYVDSSSDVVVEGSNEGTDSVSASTSTYTLGDNLEFLILTGSGASGAGNSVANTLLGNATANLLEGGDGNDSLFGGGGDDTLDGGNGNDTMSGGTGDDFYYVDSTSDFISDSGGTNIVYYKSSTVSQIQISSISSSTVTDFTSPATLTGGISFEFIALSEILPGNSLANEISGGSGNDTIDGQGGDDTIDGNSGNDSLVGGTGDDFIYGGAGRDTLTGDAGADYLEGETGNDSIVGGDQNDTLVGGDGSDTLLGGNDSDLIYGGSGNDSLLGDLGNDTLVGGDGTDTLVGGAGNDVYYLDTSNSDVIVETGANDIDTIVTNSSLTLWQKSDSNSNIAISNPYYLIENLVYDETYAGVTGVGVTLTGNARSNSIQGGSGNDWLDGGVSVLPNLGDTLNGGSGSDTYIIDNPYDWIIEDQTSDSDSDIDTVYTYVNFDPLPNDFENSFTRAWSFANADLASFFRLDNFVFMDGVIRGIGNSLDNSFTGNNENNIILGLAGNDTLVGNAGDDSLYGDWDHLYVTDPTTGTNKGYDTNKYIYPYNPGDFDFTGISDAENQKGLLGNIDDGITYGKDLLIGGDGNDYLVGKGNNDTLVGGEGVDMLDGGTEIDSMVGGNGNDIYYQDNELDVIVELADEGNDIVFSSQKIHLLQNNIESAVIYGSDVQFAVGNDSDNDLSVCQINSDIGPVTLSGGLGNDKLYGYYKEEVRDYIYTKDDIELAKNRNADDYLVGGAGDDVIDGGAGADTLEGGLGNDTLVIDQTVENGDTTAYDKIWEFGYEGGNDWVKTSVSINLRDFYTDSALGLTELQYVERGMFIENLTGTGASLSGNFLNNFIISTASASCTLAGELGNDFLIGSKGDDSLDGGEGKDTLCGTTEKLKGYGEIDTLTGGELYILGDASNVYYNSGRGRVDHSDYAFITDGSKVQVKGFNTNTTSGYVAHPTTAFAGTGTYLYLDNADLNNRYGSVGDEDELIAFFQGYNGKIDLVVV